MSAGVSFTDGSERLRIATSAGSIPSDADLQRAAGSARLVLAGSDRGTRIVDLFQRSPIRIMFPGARHTAVEEAVLLNTAGGIAGGDRLEVAVTALANASVTVTSQAAERVYRALNKPAHIATRLELHADAKIAWLPQETILFNGGRLRRMTEIELSTGAELLALEWLVMGRAAHGEEIVGGQVSDGWRVKRDGRLIWADRFHAADEVFPQLQSRALLADLKAIATLVYFGPEVDARRESLRELLPLLKCYCAVTVVAGILIARLAAVEALHLKNGLQELLLHFSRTTGCTVFRPPKMWSC